MEDFTEADIAQHPNMRIVGESEICLGGTSNQLPRAIRDNIEDAMNTMI